MERTFNFITEKKSENDGSVTSTYMDILREACERVGGVTFTAKGERPGDRCATVVSDSALTALGYYFKGYRDQIVWMQGVLPEESYMRRRSRLRRAVLSAIERYVLRRARLVLLVSDEMLRHYEAKYRLSLRDRAIIMPCFNEGGLNEAAFAPEKYGKNTFLYVGGLASWQCFAQTAAAYAEIEARSGGDTHFFVYTFEREAASEILKASGAKSFSVEYAPKEELSSRIAGIKYGFVLREDCAVNRVATPTKLSNYVSNGIIPIYSDCLRSFAALDRSVGLGVVCNIDGGVDAVLSDMERGTDAATVKEKCRAIFGDYYRREKYVELIDKRLRTL